MATPIPPSRRGNRGKIKLERGTGLLLLNYYFPKRCDHMSSILLGPLPGPLAGAHASEGSGSIHLLLGNSASASTVSDENKFSDTRPLLFSIT
jgi:hypothetical protein